MIWKLIGWRWALALALAGAATKYVRRKGVTERATVTIDGEGGDE